MRVDGRRFEDLACPVHHGHLDAGTQSRVESDCGAASGGRSKQHVAQVGGEDAHGFGFGLLEEADAEIDRKLRKKAAPRLLGGGQKPGVARTAVVGHTQECGHGVLKTPPRAQSGLGVGRVSLSERQLQHTLLLTPQQCQHPV